MKRFFQRILPTAIASGVGLVTLAAFVVPDWMLPLGFAALRAMFITWASILAAFALLAGFINAFGVHMVRMTRRVHNWTHSMAFLLGVIVMGGAVGYDFVQGGLKFTPGGPATGFVFQNIIVQLELAVAALIPFFLIFAAYRILRRTSDDERTYATRPLWASAVFIVATLIVLLRALTMLGDPLLADIETALGGLVDAAALGGTRGLLIGVALGTIFTGLRVLAGVQRPHSEL